VFLTKFPERLRKNHRLSFQTLVRETALPEGKNRLEKSRRIQINSSALRGSDEPLSTRRVLRLSAVQDFPMKIISTAFVCPRGWGSSKIL
jgi:hypothetical protein